MTTQDETAAPIATELVIGIVVRGGCLDVVRSSTPIRVVLFDKDNYDVESDENRADMDAELAEINALPVVAY